MPTGYWTIAKKCGKLEWINGKLKSKHNYLFKRQIQRTFSKRILDGFQVEIQTSWVELTSNYEMQFYVNVNGKLRRSAQMTVYFSWATMFVCLQNPRTPNSFTLSLHFLNNLIITISSIFCLTRKQKCNWFKNGIRTLASHLITKKKKLECMWILDDAFCWDSFRKSSMNVNLARPIQRMWNANYTNNIKIAHNSRAHQIADLKFLVCLQLILVWAQHEEERKTSSTTTNRRRKKQSNEFECRKD